MSTSSSPGLIRACAWTHSGARARTAVAALARRNRRRSIVDIHTSEGAVNGRPVDREAQAGAAHDCAAPVSTARTSGLRRRGFPVTPAHAGLEVRLRELRPLVGRENGTDLLQHLHAQRDGLSEKLLDLGGLRGDGVRVATVQRELTQLALSGAQRFPRLLLLVAMPAERGANGGHLIVRESEALLPPTHAMLARGGGR